MLQKNKERLRQELSAGTTPREPGRIAQRLRGLPAYRRSERIFVSPAGELSQIRINSLVDGKELIMPGPALKDGFYVFRPYSINFRELEYAVSFKGIKKYGQPMDLGKEWPVDLFLTEGLALNREGVRLGDGNGFFDLAFAILSRSYPKNTKSKVGMVCNEEQVVDRSIPRAPWDIAVDFYISSEGLSEISPESGTTGREREAGPIFWEQLTNARIKKVTPLWKIWKNRS